MLLAEIRGKIKTAFACRECGDEAGVDALRASAVEDGLSSHVLGALRHLPSSVGAGVLFDCLSLPRSSEEHIEVELWPFRSVRVRLLDGGPARELGCEPDALLESPTALVVIEAKLGMKLGSDPSQLPREARLAHDAARGRPWRLLCITADAREPSIASFVVRNGALGLGPAATIAESVASYFAAERELGDALEGPTPDEVRTSVGWLGWSDVATLFDRSARHPEIAPSARTLLGDVCALLERRGLTRTTFGGFGQFSGRLAEPNGVSWSTTRRERILWSSLRAFEGPSTFPSLLGSARSLFAKLVVPPLTSWPAAGWLTSSSNSKEKKER